MASQYMIGTTAENIAAIDALFEKHSDAEPRGMPVDYPRVVPLANGATRNLGIPEQIWHWDFLSEDMRNNLHDYAGMTVYVHTRKNDGDFGYFTAILVWPEKEPEHSANKVLDLSIILRGLTAYTPEEP